MVVDQARQRPGLLTCAHIDILWTLGEALARSGDPAHSYEAYSYILGNCEGEAERLATVQKASVVLPPQGAEALAALGRRMPDGRGEFDTLRFDNLRGQMGRVASHESASLPDPANLKAFADHIGKSRRDLQLAVR
ncbi:hypothetical protein [Aureimonas sp. AU20]|uniref:hypothetical protein n=1 Tax=Aureimonas sp. AU20 TaxID=1349819 RepID=UPI00071FB88D|nr:hypothetical protein [Aureimonas sp. AU20]ALN74811.1 hypothetical protein M673_18985 [Aureimonas sp. AU20]